jgi:HK97 family phage major capsid protein
MSTRLFELTKQREKALSEAEGIISAIERANRAPSSAEDQMIKSSMATVKGLGDQIKQIQSQNTIQGMFPDGRVIPAAGSVLAKPQAARLTAEYMDEFFAYIQTNGKKVGATLYEGSNPAGGFIVPVVVDNQVVPLAPNEMAVRRLATVIPTASDIKLPRKGAFGVASAKAELASFGESELTLEQFTLSAFMAGIVEEISWELAQDVPTFQSTTVDDMVLAQQMFEENLYVNGTGIGQAQGLIGNVGAGVTEEPDANGNLVTVDGTFDLIAKLNAVYHPGASFLMARPTSVIIRKAQAQSNLFNPVWTRAGGQDFLHGYPVEYSASMPAAAHGATPVLFGDFKRGYIIGDRGGSGINVKVLDQPKATSGILQLLAYRRTDGRVRRSEAIQGYHIANVGS